MTREEAIEQLKNIRSVPSIFIDETIKELVEALQEPPTLADFLGWDEGQEYDVGIYDGGIHRIKYGRLEQSIGNEEWCNARLNLTPVQIRKLRQAKKVERKLRAYHVKDEYSYDCLIKELVEKGYTKTLGGFLTIKTSYYNSVKETTRNYIYLHDNDRVSFSHELVRDGYDIIDYHKEEPKYYAKIKGNDLLNSNFVYVNYNTISERLALGIKSERGNWKTNFTKKEWKNLGVTDENFDLKEVE